MEALDIEVIAVDHVIYRDCRAANGIFMLPRRYVWRRLWAVGAHPRLGSLGVVPTILIFEWAEVCSEEKYTSNVRVSIYYLHLMNHPGLPAQY